MVVMQLPLGLLCVTGIDIQESPQIGVLGPERTWDVFNGRGYENPADVQNKKAEKSLQEVEEREILH